MVRQVKVIRAGEEGCFILSPTQKPMWLLPYCSKRGLGKEEPSEKIVNPPGAGNAFLGALTVELQTTNGSLRGRACYGARGASYALEQADISHDDDGVKV